MVVKKYNFSNYTYQTFCYVFKENLMEEKKFEGGFYKNSIFNINGNTLILTQAGNSSNKTLTIGLDEKLINETIEKIKSKGFALEEITK